MDQLLFVRCKWFFQYFIDFKGNKDQKKNATIIREKWLSASLSSETTCIGEVQWAWVFLESSLFYCLCLEYHFETNPPLPFSLQFNQITFFKLERNSWRIVWNQNSEIFGVGISKLGWLHFDEHSLVALVIKDFCFSQEDCLHLPFIICFDILREKMVSLERIFFEGGKPAVLD